MALGKEFYLFIYLSISLLISLYYYYYFLLWFPKGLSLLFPSSWALGVRWQQRSGSERIPILPIFSVLLAPIFFYRTEKVGRWKCNFWTVALGVITL